MAKIILFEHVNFGGNALVLKDQDVESLGNDFNDEISSVIVIDGEWTMTRHA